MVDAPVARRASRSRVVAHKIARRLIALRVVGSLALAAITLLPLATAFAQEEEDPFAGIEEMVVVGSLAGYDSHPAWYHNLMAQDQVKVKVANDFFQVTARVASGDERAKVWEKMATIYPPYKDYQASAGSREIPVVIIERA